MGDIRTYKSEGIVLKRSNFGEADKIIVFYTKHFGKVGCLAKGIRRLTSRKRGCLEIFNRVVFFAARGRGMDIVTEAEVLDNYQSWRRDLAKVSAAYEMAEMVDRLTAEGSEQEEVYFLLAEYLRNLEQTDRENLSLLVESFGGKMLRVLGFWPKDRQFPSGFSPSAKIEEIIERELKSKNFAQKL